jgi:hypothetical protein
MTLIRILARLVPAASLIDRLGVSLRRPLT